MLSRIIVLVACVATASVLSMDDVEDVKSYKGYAVIRTTPKDVDSLKLLKGMQEGNLWNIDWHRQPHLVGYQVDMMIAPEHLADVELMLKGSKIEYTIHISDLQTLIDAQHDSNQEDEEGSELSEMRGKSHKLPHLSHFRYHRYGKISKYLDSLCGNANAQPCEVINFGTTYERRTMKAIKIGTDGPKKSIVWLDAGIHAREWIAPSVALFIIDRLVRKSCESDLLLENHVFYVVPSMNPDGYEYTHTTDRMWRKTRTPNHGSTCLGTDPNRNWDFHFGGVGTSSDPCSNVYHGSRAFSEPSTHSASILMEKINRDKSKGNMNVYISLHSYSQLWLLPWGYTYTLPHNYKEMEAVALKAARNQKRVGKLPYRVGAVSHILYQVSGASQEWAKGVLGTRYAYTVELPDTGAHGFVLPAKMIKSTARGMHSAMKTLLREITKRG